MILGEEWAQDRVGTRTCKSPPDDFNVVSAQYPVVCFQNLGIACAVHEGSHKYLVAIYSSVN
jgi:hypothetical protein